jgi:hypothetical protein
MRLKLLATTVAIGTVLLAVRTFERRTRPDVADEHGD